MTDTPRTAAGRALLDILQPHRFVMAGARLPPLRDRYAARILAIEAEAATPPDTRLREALVEGLKRHRRNPDGTMCSCGQAFFEVEDENGQKVWQSWEVHAAAALLQEADTAPSTPALDVSRLARALEALWREKWGGTATGVVQVFGAAADEIAAAYASGSEAVEEMRE